jgi:hypothetical protein
VSAGESNGASVAEAALAYCRRGWRVFPLHGKVPLAGSRGFKDASADPERVANWPAGCNAGIQTGAGLALLDVDPDRGGDDSLHELEREHGRLPVTVSAETGSGGHHYYFAGRIGCSTDELGPGLDTRGDGGYVVAPPSVHPDTGRRYAWDNDPDEVPLAPLPGWLPEGLTRTDNGKAHPLEEWRSLAANGVAEGARNVRCAQLVGHLLARGVDPFVALELLLAWDAQRNRPPLGGEVVARTVRSIAEAELRKWA